MKQEDKPVKNKGGRPFKAIKRNVVLTLKCSRYEQVRIAGNAKKAGMTLSEFLRSMGLHGQIVVTEKALPKEVLLFTGTLNHMAANLNQLTKRHNSVTDILTPVDRAGLDILSKELKGIAASIKIYLQ